MNNGLIYSNYLLDEDGYKHYIDTKLGQGGQGAVFKTTDKNIVIKVSLNPNTGEIISNKNQYIKFKDNIDEVRILPLSKELHIAKPSRMLKEPVNGYVMRLLSDMQPIKKLIIPNSDSIAKFYNETGGLRRRLSLLKNIARELAIINSKSIVYADISPENIFVSSNIDDNEIWFIDADNMRFTVDFTNTIYTPGYGAPEVVKGISSNNTLSDIYSFALIAFELLTLISPFDGELLLNNNSEDKWDNDCDDEWDDDSDNYLKAEKGELPWIEDEDDDSNFSDKGIPRNLVLSGKLKNLFERTFGRKGRLDPCNRPSASEWYDVLKQAESATIKCTKCNSTFYLGNNRCPFCNQERNRFYLITVYDYFNSEHIIVDDNNTCDIKTEEISLYKKSYFKVIDIDKTKKYLYSNDIMDISITDPITKFIEIEIKNETTSIRNLSNNYIRIIEENNVYTLEKNKSHYSYDLEKVTLLVQTDSVKEKRISFRLL